MLTIFSGAPAVDPTTLINDNEVKLTVKVSLVVVTINSSLTQPHANKLGNILCVFFVGEGAAGEAPRQCTDGNLREKEMGIPQVRSHQRLQQ